MSPIHGKRRPAPKASGQPARRLPFVTAAAAVACVLFVAGGADAALGAAGGSPSIGLVSSSVAAGQSLSGVVPWTVVTSGSVASVEFWANDQRLATVTGGSPYTFELDTSKLHAGANALGLAIVGSDGSRVTPQVGTVTVTTKLVNTAAPTIGGVAQVGQTLTASVGTWTPTPTSYRTFWERCRTSDDACAPLTQTSVTGTTSTTSTYTVAPGDAGYRLGFVVLAQVVDGAGDVVGQGGGEVVMNAIVAPAPGTG